MDKNVHSDNTAVKSSSDSGVMTPLPQIDINDISKWISHQLTDTITRNVLNSLTEGFVILPSTGGYSLGYSNSATPTVPAYPYQGMENDNL